MAIELLRITIGYGIGLRYFRSLAWALGLTILGGFVFFPSVAPVWPDQGASFLFSFDQLLPIINIAPGADDIAETVDGWRHWYLAAQRLLEFLLGSFVVAGLSGIGRR